MNFQIITFGCKLNQAESDKISADLNMAGFKRSYSKPDIIILNICAVTHKAVREARQKLAQLKRKHPRAKIIITGCIIEKNWPGVDVWVENKDRIIEIIKDKLISRGARSRASTEHKPFLPERSRALIKIQTGCDNYCAYCIVPFMRGKPQSIPIKKIISDIQQKEKQGFQEIVLTGINIGLYCHSEPAQAGEESLANASKRYSRIRGGSFVQQSWTQDDNSQGLIYLLKSILEQTNISRIRLGSLWPTHISQELIELYSKNLRLCPHFHLSIQSGSNKILKLMGRNYTRQDIFKIIKKCRAKIPKINFTCDMIVGFPAETDKDFQDTCQLIKQIGFSKVHVFKYSKRPYTRAGKMANQIPEKVKQERSRKLIKLAEQIALKTKKKFIGQKFYPVKSSAKGRGVPKGQFHRVNVLWEQKKAGYYYGFTENYIRVRKKIKKEEKLENKIEEIKLKTGLI